MFTKKLIVLIGKLVQIAISYHWGCFFQLNSKLLSIKLWDRYSWVRSLVWSQQALYNLQGGSRGGGLKKLEKIWFFGVKSWFSTRNTPKIFAPPSARRIFFKCAPLLTLNPGSAPDLSLSFSTKHMVLRSDRMVVGFQAIGICSLHLINVCIKNNADSNSSLQKWAYDLRLTSTYQHS